MTLFPFIGAGDADYFEFASLSVLFEREPSDVERKRLSECLPRPLQGSWSGALASLASEYGVRAAIVASYGRTKRVHGDERTMGSAKTIAAFNRDIERWLDEAHAIVPIRLALREPDSEAGGTRFNERHHVSERLLLATLPAWLEARDQGRVTPELEVLHRALGVLLEDNAAHALGDEWREWYADVAAGDFGTPACAIRKALESGDATSAIELMREEVDFTQLLPMLYRLGAQPALRPQLATLLAAIGPEALPADLGMVVLGAWAEAGLAAGTLAPQAAERALARWRDVLRVDANAGASLAGLLHAMISVSSWSSARRVAAFAVTRADLHPSAYCNALFVAQSFATGLAIDPELDRSLLDACLPHAAGNPAIYVNAACLYLELEDAAEAHSMLRAAIANGRREGVQRVVASPLFERYQDDPRFANVIA